MQFRAKVDNRLLCLILLLINYGNAFQAARRSDRSGSYPTRL